jgi:hypothetical protein
VVVGVVSVLSGEQVNDAIAVKEMIDSVIIVAIMLRMMTRTISAGSSR